MTRSNKNSEAKQDDRNQKKQEPYGQDQEKLNLSSLYDGLSEDSALNAQKRPINLLTNTDIPVFQRQRLTAQIGNIHGNLRLQRIIDSVKRQTNLNSRNELNQETLVIHEQNNNLVQLQTDAGVSDYPRDASLPAGVPEPVQEAPSTPMTIPEIPTELRSSVDVTSLADNELQYRLDLIQQTLMQFMQSSPDTQLLQEQANQINGILAERQIEALVREELEGFLAEFSNIIVTVRWVENTDTQCVEQSEEVAVHPPYFKNVIKPKQSSRPTLARYNTAIANRRAANRATRSLLREIFRRQDRGGWGLARAKVGKSHPEDIRRILQAALDRNLIQPGRGRNRPNGEDLRNWLIRYGIGVDCSAFVSQALNQVTERVQNRPLVANEQINRGSRQLRGSARGFTGIRDTTQLQPGDTMYIPGHIRIITIVRRDENGEVIFTTAESRAGGRADVGPDQAEWRYHNNRLQIRRTSNDRWSNSREKPTFGRYNRLQEATERVGSSTSSSELGDYPLPPTNTRFA